MFYAVFSMVQLKYVFLLFFSSLNIMYLWIPYLNHYHRTHTQYNDDLVGPQFFFYFHKHNIALNFQFMRVQRRIHVRIGEWGMEAPEMVENLEFQNAKGHLEVFKSEKFLIICLFCCLESNYCVKSSDSDAIHSTWTCMSTKQYHWWSCMLSVIPGTLVFHFN